MITLKTNQLYILSGPPATGKSTLVVGMDVPPEFVISSDTIRKQMFGERRYVNGGDVCISLPQSSGKEVYEVLRTMLRVRMSQRLTTIIDATCCTESDRNEYARIATEFGVKTTVLIMMTDRATAALRNSSRPNRVSESVMDKSFSKMIYTSNHNYIEIYPDEPDIHFIDSYIRPPSNKLDVIGDVHGLYDELVKFLAKYDYYIEDEIIKHPDDRKLLFLGDVVDRGPKSVETLNLVARSVTLNGHYMIKGNHDHKIWKYFKSLSSGKKPLNLSAANAETVSELIQLPTKDRDILLNFIGGLPHYYMLGDFAFTHADTTCFDPELLTHEDAVYGCSNWGTIDSDLQYQQNFDKGINQFMLIRGHITPTNNTSQESVFVLEMRQAFGGKLAMLSMDEFITELYAVDELGDPINESSQSVFQRVVKTFDVEFDYDAVRKKRKLANAMYELLGKKLVTVTTDNYGLKLFKYSKRVFWDNLWSQNEYLFKARGIVIDPYGRIIQHTLDKTFNYLENGAGTDIDDDDEVIAVDKLNGFFAAITRHPYKNELLVTTSGSFDSPHVEYINEYLVHPLRGNLMKFTHHRNITLMFEVIHPSDPHIIEYNSQDQGLYLIAARGKLETDQPLLEAELDFIADELDVRRPEWVHTTMGQARQRIKTMQDEGLMIRTVLPDQQFICKMKSAYYLTTKLLGRLSVANTHKMFNNTQTFKKMVDEEFYAIIDLLITTTTVDELTTMDQASRTNFMRNLIEDYLDA